MPQLKNKTRMFCPFCENEINVYLLSIDRELEEDLNKGNLPERLKNLFENEGISFSENITITKENEDKWVITDEEKKNIYIAKKEDERLNVYDVKIKAICPSCKEEIPLREAKAKCPCDYVNDLFIPEGTQVLETHYIGDEGSKEVFARLHFSEVETKCDRCGGRFHIWIIRGVKSACLLTGGKECRGINQSILGGMANGCGEIFQKIYLTAQKKYFGRHIPSSSYFLIKRFGELVFCILTGFLLATIYPYTIFSIFGLQGQISLPYRIFLGGLFSGGLYFSFLVLKETVIVCGELETKLKDNMKEGIFIPFFVFRKLIFLFLVILIFGICIFDEIWIYGLNIHGQIYGILGKDAQIRWVDNLASMGYSILFALIIPVFAGFGFLLYLFWADSQKRYGSSLKSSFLDAVPSIEKLSEIAMHSVIFLASAVFLNDIVWNHFGRSTILGQIYSGETQEIIFLYRTLVIGVIVIMPLVLYFLYLGKLANNLKAIELGKIDGKLKRLSPPDSLSSENKEDIQREIESLLSYRNTVSRSLRWVVGADYGSRMLLLLFIGLESYFIGQIFV